VFKFPVVTTNTLVTRSDENKKKVLIELIKSMNATEQKWLIRIILKDMRMGIKHESIFKIFHPYALDLYNACSNLREVCEKCISKNFVYTSKDIKLFAAVKPMLATLATPEKLKSYIRDKEFVF